MREVPLASRVVEVIADHGPSASPRFRYGSGCVVVGRVVLTAAHVVADAGRVQVRGPDKTLYSARMDGEFVGEPHGPGPDLALVEIDHAAGFDLPAMDLAVVDRDSVDAEPVQRCHAVGYPWFAERPSPGAVRDTVDAYGHVPVLSRLASGLLSMQVTSAPRELPQGQESLGKSQWSGMSGAPVVADSALLGVVIEHAAREGPSTITLTPLTALEHDPNRPQWGPGVANPAAWWDRLGAGGGPAGFRRLPPRRVQAGVVHGDVVIHETGRPTAPGRTPAMAPALSSHFVHRFALQRRIADALRSRTRQLSLCGAGGFGKTTLASWAGRQAEVRELFPGGVLWVELGQNPSAERTVGALTGLVTVLTGSPPNTYADVASAAHAFRAALPERPTLLVVDDVWNAVDLRPFLDLGEQTTLLVTSRRSGLLNGAGTEIHVDGMNDHEATELLIADGETGTLGPLLRRSRRWPLALVMLSGILRGLADRHAMTTDEAVAALVDELDDQGITTLDELSDTDLVRNISRTLELSLTDLPAATRQRLVALAAFPEGEVVPYWLLERLWGLSALRVRTEADRFVSRSLALATHTDGLQLHDVTREALRHREPTRMAEVSAGLLDRMRPAGGWHRLPGAEALFASGLAFHLRQAGRVDELAGLLRDMRFLVARLGSGGPAALESDVEEHLGARGDDGYARALRESVRRAGHLLTAYRGGTEVGPTLEIRLFGQRGVWEELRYVEEARSGHGLIPLLAMPDHDNQALLRSFPVHGDGSCLAIDWHPDGDRLATVGHGPQLQVVSADGRHVSYSVTTDNARIEGVRWSPDGTRTAITSDTGTYPFHLPGGRATCTLAVHDPESGTEIAATVVRRGPDRAHLALSWAPDSHCLAVLHDRIPMLWAPGAGTPLTPLLAEGDESAGLCDALAWHPEHGLLVHAVGRDSPRGWEGILLRWADPFSGEPPPRSGGMATSGAGRRSWRGGPVPALSR
ncbi:NB-ARC domain-containing protein [Streptomyces sp. NPDC048442]|uniref:NB-ARC domain-containing protein n=1 Tax=Streptomyces sp. NPDC048442 TaxID=3154823 RepID=UPI0034322C01